MDALAVGPGVPPQGSRSLQPRDYAWALAAPLYLLIGTVRHEGSHALVGWLMGFPIVDFAFWPTRYGWGHVRFGTDVSWPVLAAPYVVDVLFMALGSWWALRIRDLRSGLWINVVIIGILSPAVNSAYNYFHAFHGGGDVAGLFQVFPWYAVHGWFLIVGVASLFSIVYVFRRALWRSAPGASA